MNFVHETLAQRVRFALGQARAQVAAEIEAMGADRVMVVTGGPIAAAARDIMADVAVTEWYEDVAMHVPADVAARAVAAARASACDVVVAVGGGSTTGLAKAVALETSLPVVAVPTTFAGSEATQVWGITTDGVKRTGTDPRVLPRAIVYDATLLSGLPAEMAVSSAVNALAHSIDALWAPRADPINAATATESMRTLRLGLLSLVDRPDEPGGREETLLGAYLAAVAFSSAGSGLHHKICHVLGGMFDLPHAQTHRVVLPHVVELNAPHAPAAARRMAQAFGTDDAVQGLHDLYGRLGPTGSLREFGMPEDGIPAAVTAVLEAAPASNPAPLTPAVVETLLRRAWEGDTA